MQLQQRHHISAMNNAPQRIGLQLRGLSTCLLMVISLCFASCKNYIEYNGPQEPDKLVVESSISAGALPRVRVGHTCFFMNEWGRDTITFPVVYVTPDGDTIREHHTLANSYGWLTDAVVKMRVNHSEWHELKCLRSIIYDIADTTCHFQSGDYVELEVSHPDYPTVTSSQVIPQDIEATVLSYRFTGDGWVVVDMQLSPYRGAETDVICIGLGQGAITFMEPKGIIFSGGQVSYTDSMIWESDPLAHLYSTDRIFSLAYNRQTPHGFYTTGNGLRCLCIPASALQEPKKVTLFADRPNVYGNDMPKRDFRLDSLFLSVHTVTQAGYFYATSLSQSSEDNMYVEPNGIAVADTKPILNMSDSVKKYIDEYSKLLGGQEDIQLYTNIQGGVGCFSATSTVQYIWVQKPEYKNSDNNK